MNWRDRLARARRLLVDGLGGDREDAARRAEARDAVLDLAPPQGGDARAGPEVGPDLARDPRRRAISSARSSQTEALDILPSYMSRKASEPRGGSPRTALECRRRIEGHPVALRPQLDDPPAGPPAEGLAQLLQRGLVAEVPVNSAAARGDAAVEEGRVDEDPCRGARRVGVRERLPSASHEARRVVVVRRPPGWANRPMSSRNDGRVSQATAPAATATQHAIVKTARTQKCIARSSGSEALGPARRSARPPRAVAGAA